jgi:Fe-S cluster assembly iron-binding protein IscA
VTSHQAERRNENLDLRIFLQSSGCSVAKQATMHWLAVIVAKRQSWK